MSTTEEVGQQQEEKRGPGRPSKAELETRAKAEMLKNRPKRTPVSGSREMLTIYGNKDPEFEYRWVLDKDETGQRIYRFTNAGWTFVNRDAENLDIGENTVFKSSGHGNIYRVPAGGGQYLYLMKIHKEWYEEDIVNQQKQIDELEQTMIHREQQEAGRYGSISLSR